MPAENATQVAFIGHYLITSKVIRSTKCAFPISLQGSHWHTLKITFLRIFNNQSLYISFQLSWRCHFKSVVSDSGWHDSVSGWEVLPENAAQGFRPFFPPWKHTLSPHRSPPVSACDSRSMCFRVKVDRADFPVSGLLSGGLKQNPDPDNYVHAWRNELLLFCAASVKRNLSLSSVLTAENGVEFNFHTQSRLLTSSGIAWWIAALKAMTTSPVLVSGSYCR